MSPFRSISPKSRLGLGAGIVLALAAVALATGADAAPKSLPMRGSVESHLVTEGCTSPVGLCFVDAFRGTLNGPGENVASSLTPTPAPGILGADVAIVIHDAQGDLSCRAELVFNATPGSEAEFAMLCEVTGGTRRYAGASGYLLGHGAIPPGETAYRGSYEGKIVLPS